PPPSRYRGLLRKQRLRQPVLGFRGGSRRILPPVHQPLQDTPHVRVQHRMPLLERETRHRGRRVCPYPGQRQQFVVRVRHCAAVPLHDHRRTRVQPQRTTRIAEPPPHPHGFPRRIGRQVLRGRPAFHPRLPGGQHPRHRGLLEHHIAHQHTPRGHLRGAPREIPCVGVIPGENGCTVGV